MSWGNVMPCLRVGVGRFRLRGPAMTTNSTGLSLQSQQELCKTHCREISAVLQCAVCGDRSSASRMSQVRLPFGTASRSVLPPKMNTRNSPGNEASGEWCMRRRLSDGRMEGLANRTTPRRAARPQLKGFLVMSSLFGETVSRAG
jgi:hypothetical protein